MREFKVQYDGQLVTILQNEDGSFNWPKGILKRRELTIAANVLAHGTGVLNIDGTRIRRAADDVPGWHETGSKGEAGFLGERGAFTIRDCSPEEVQARCGGKGRWPANVLLSHDERCVLVGTRSIKGCPAEVVQGGKLNHVVGVDVGDGTRRTTFEGYGDAAGMEEVDEWACVPGCPVRMLDSSVVASRSKKGKPRRSKEPGEGWGMTATGAEYNDAGGPSRFLFQSKPSKREREEGLMGIVPCHKCGGLSTTEHVDAENGRTVKCLRNDHPTLKSIELMRWLCRLVAPPGGIVLDPFAGSGTTGVAAVLEGFRFLGIDQDPRYHEVMRARLAWAAKETVQNDKAEG